ncbi:MAG: hypothetical protein ABIM89_00905 [Mycobacteriales bacterium]
MTVNRVRVATVALSLMVSLAACGSDGDDKESTAAATAPSTANAASAPGSSSPAGAESIAASSPAVAATAEASSAAPVSSAAPAPAGGTTCDLLTAAEVATAIGAKVVKAVPTVQPLGAKQCVWANDTVPVKTYSLSITRTEDLPEAMRGAGQSATTLYEGSKNLFPGAQPLPGYGDEATIAKSTIMARKGDVFISASTFFGTSDEAIAALKSLTKQAIDQL